VGIVHRLVDLPLGQQAGQLAAHGALRLLRRPDARGAQPRGPADGRRGQVQSGEVGVVAALDAVSVEHQYRLRGGLGRHEEREQREPCDRSAHRGEVRGGTLKPC
jgi:hypothetical protein